MNTTPPAPTSAGPANPVGGPQRAASTTPPAGFILAALALWLLATAGMRPLLLPDEGRYASVAWAMALGDSGVPLLNGLPYFHKPPLMYGLDALAMKLFGANPFTARVAPALGAWLMGAALLLDLRGRIGPRAAAITLGLLATMPFFFVGAQYANHDMLVAGLITLAIVCARRAVESVPRVDLRWQVAAWAACALAVLAKGLIGVVLPGLVVGGWLLASGRWRRLPGLLHPLGLLAFALLALPWFVLMQQRYPGFFDYFIMEQHFRRYAQTHFNNVQPGWFFVPVLPLLTLPWSLWLVAAWRRWWLQRRRPVLADGAMAQTAGPAGPGTGETPGFHLWWLVAVVLFFSLPSSKLVGYVLPALAPLAALLGLTVARGQAWRWVLPLAALACVAVVAGLAWKSPNSHRDVGLALGQRVQAGDLVVFVDEAFFDLPVYAGLRQPPVVLADWADPGIDQRDNWRKELRDAGRFDPAAAARLLWPTARAGELRCTKGAVWWVSAKARPLPAGLDGLTLEFSGRHAQLWRAVGGKKPGCP